MLNLKKCGILRGLPKLLFEHVPGHRVRRLLGQQSMALRLRQPTEAKILGGAGKDSVDSEWF
jgi:hypothetical protein